VGRRAGPVQAAPGEGVEGGQEVALAAELVTQELDEVVGALLADE